MAFIYRVSYDIRPDQMSQLEIGAALERVLGYMRVLMPAQAGFITSRSMFSLDFPDRTHLVFESVWDTWEDVEKHRQSPLVEEKVLQEFEPHVALEDLDVHVYEEVD